MTKKRALLSVSDKSGLVDFARFLVGKGVQLLSTGGTARHLRDAGLEVTDVSEVTGFPEILDGRVKTLHPAIHGGLLARRDVPEHLATAKEHGIGMIDFVIVNLYPFAETAADTSKSFQEVIEQIDIGGPSMLRSAAKNHAAVTVVCDPTDYPRVTSEMEAKGETSEALRRGLAAKVFTHTSGYDAMIANYLGGKEEENAGWPGVYNLSLPLAQAMRYGENPHQAAAFYRDPSVTETSIAGARQLHGKELSYNNILDAEGALEMVRDFVDPEMAAAVIVKHSNPCGIAISHSLAKAYTKARATDPDSAFGGIVALSKTVDGETAKIIAETFNEIIIAPGFDAEALEILTAKKNLRLLETGEFTPKQQIKLVRGVVGGMLVTDRDLGTIDEDGLKVVSRKKPDEEDIPGLLFAWRCVKWVKSNAIVYTSSSATIGIGAGQMSRVDSANFGARKAKSTLKGSIMASDAFFPFRDCVDIAAKHDVRAIIQPGGSVRDDEVIHAADELGIIMVFTGNRHFRH
ncbi:MAG: bifunctional phosphoribosylaminoimidazolecarboxamide formyltransferase/IMP cyclohydrolase [Candidatus Sumerlaeia bacterium]|nr:bifunctional phosphoribosylaminoimidazolecarboxamide formyltransferase/IMP cyclohydrolase [Candidatus Sumerlaeia bacterium]